MKRPQLISCRQVVRGHLLVTVADDLSLPFPLKHARRRLLPLLNGSMKSEIRNLTKYFQKKVYPKCTGNILRPPNFKSDNEILCSFSTNVSWRSLDPSQKNQTHQKIEDSTMLKLNPQHFEVAQEIFGNFDIHFGASQELALMSPFSNEFNLQSSVEHQHSFCTPSFDSQSILNFFRWFAMMAPSTRRITVLLPVWNEEWWPILIHHLCAFPILLPRDPTTFLEFGVEPTQLPDWHAAIFQISVHPDILLSNEDKESISSSLLNWELSDLLGEHLPISGKEIKLSNLSSSTGFCDSILVSTPDDLTFQSINFDSRSH